MFSSNSRRRWIWSALGVFLVALIGCLLFVRFVPRFRWRAQVVELKATGRLPEISWNELYRLHRHSDPFNLQGLVNNQNPYMTIKDPFTLGSDLSAGEDLFESNCSFCHGAKGVGGRSGPALKERQMVYGSSDWALFKTISNGIAGTGMPASPLSQDNRWKLVTYVKSVAQGAETPTASPLAAQIARVAPVRYEDILAADRDPHQWLTYSGSYDGERFSPNDRITPANVSNLRLVWMHQYSTSETLIETSPLIVNGFMFVTLPPNRVEALDAKTGDLIWSYERQLPQHLSACCGLVNRGLAVMGNLLFFGTLDAHLVALDMKTGAVVWDVEIADYHKGYSITSAPLAFKKIVVTGVAGGEFGARGFISARDVSTGMEVWRFDTIPQPGQAGAQTWEADALKTGGGPTWLTGTFDPERNLIYWPVGNPSPNYEGDTRRGDNLYTDSMVALDADHGTLHWYFQFTPHDQFDWDATEILVSFDKMVNGKPKHFLAQANRNAFYYLLDRDTGKFVSAQAFAKQTWAEKIDRNGRPVVNPTALPKPQGSTVFPSVAGATNWMSPSYSPITGLIYVPVTEGGGNFSTSTPIYHAGEFFLGGSSQTFTDPPQQSAVRALDAVTGEMRWEYRYQAWNAGGLLSTKGGIVFGGLGHIFLALDAKTGRELWRVDTGGTIKAAPVSYLIDGKQFVTIAAGQDILTFSE